jgi:excisionase family DNA binding protein
MEPQKLLWNVKEAGNALGLSPWTIRRYITIGKLRTVRLGRRVLVEPSECRRLIEEGRSSLIREATARD